MTNILFGATGPQCSNFEIDTPFQDLWNRFIILGVGGRVAKSFDYNAAQINLSESLKTVLKYVQKMLNFSFITNCIIFIHWELQVWKK